MWGTLAGMNSELKVEHERVDDIPLILALAKAVGVAEILDRHLGNHGLQAGLSNGQLAAVWVAYILSAGDHRKSALEPWIASRRAALSGLTGQALGEAEGNDDRLGRLLRRLSQDTAWNAIEAEMWQGTVMVLGSAADAEEVERVHLDSTTSYGYHTVGEDGLMQLGHSKDHRPDLGQFKLMAAVTVPARQMVAADIVAGHRADDGLYLPLIRRVRSVLGRRGLLYVGDVKMAAKQTRAAIAAGGDRYLTMLPKAAHTDEIAGWLEIAQAGEAPVAEHARTLSAKVDGHHVTWEERVVLHRSDSHRDRLSRDLDERLAKASQEILALTPEPGRGKRLFTSADTLAAAIAKIERSRDVAGMLLVTWRPEPHPAPGKPDRRRFVVKDVHRLDHIVAPRRAALGWRVLVTNDLPDRLPTGEVPAIYNQSWNVEQQFHNLKDRPLGIQPLGVSRDDQIVGLSRLLIIALRLLTLLEVKVRRALASTASSLAGLYPGQPKRATDRPTGRRLLEAIYAAQVTLTHIRGPGIDQAHVAPLPPIVAAILNLLGLPHAIYYDLAATARFDLLVSAK